MFVELINCSLFSNDHFMHDLWDVPFVIHLTTI
jgi:hypothetical protein